MATTPVINAQLDKLNEHEANQSYMLSRIAEKMGALENPADWATYQALVRAGVIDLYAPAGTILTVAHSSTLVLSVDGDGIANASVDTDTFDDAAGTTGTVYVFSYDGTNWYYNGSAVQLATYGISVEGTPVNGDSVTVSRTASSYDFNVLGNDEDQPVDENLTHVSTIQMQDIFGKLVYDPKQFLFAVTAEACTAFGWPSTGMPAGTYSVTLDHGAYNNGTGEDGTYHFTTTEIVPVGGGIRHTTMGTSQNSYATSNITGGTFYTYAADTITVIESSLTCASGSSGTNLGTTTAKDPQYKSGDYINFTMRNRYGNGRFSTSYLYQLLNSDEEELTWKPATIWSRNAYSEAPEGYLHAIDSSLKKSLVKVRKRFALSISDGYGYEDVEAYCFPANLLDVFGQQNNSIAEGPVTADGTVTRTDAYSYWQENNTGSDRKKAYNGTVSIWWLSSVSPSSPGNVRYVNSSGALLSSGAHNAYGAVPCLYIG